jgi:hypothetical protein
MGMGEGRGVFEELIFSNYDYKYSKFDINCSVMTANLLRYIFSICTLFYVVVFFFSCNGGSQDENGKLVAIKSNFQDKVLTDSLVFNEFNFYCGYEEWNRIIAKKVERGLLNSIKLKKEIGKSLHFRFEQPEGSYIGLNGAENIYIIPEFVDVIQDRFNGTNMRLTTSKKEFTEKKILGLIRYENDVLFKSLSEAKEFIGKNSKRDHFEFIAGIDFNKMKPYRIPTDKELEEANKEAFSKMTGIKVEKLPSPNNGSSLSKGNKATVNPLNAGSNLQSCIMSDGTFYMTVVLTEFYTYKEHRMNDMSLRQIKNDDSEYNVSIAISPIELGILKPQEFMFGKQLEEYKRKENELKSDSLTKERIRASLSKN